MQSRGSLLTASILTHSADTSSPRNAPGGEAALTTPACGVRATPTGWVWPRDQQTPATLAQATKSPAEAGPFAQVFMPEALQNRDLRCLRALGTLSDDV